MTNAHSRPLMIAALGLSMLLGATGSSAQTGAAGIVLERASGPVIASPSVPLPAPNVASSQRIARAITREAKLLAASRPDSSRHDRTVSPPEEKHRNWVARHPILTGTMIGFGAGFLAGYLPGNDGVFDDFTAEASGMMLGGAGAAAGAIVGWVVSR